MKFILVLLVAALLATTHAQPAEDIQATPPVETRAADDGEVTAPDDDGNENTGFGCEGAGCNTDPPSVKPQTVPEFTEPPEPSTLDGRFVTDGTKGTVDPDADPTDPIDVEPTPPPLATGDEKPIPTLGPPEPSDSGPDVGTDIPVGTIDPDATLPDITTELPYTATTPATKTTPPPFTGATQPKDKIISTLPPSTSSVSGRYECDATCNVHEYAGDGFCDDKNNKCGCDWDGGDCCGFETEYIYCTYCTCRDPLLSGTFNCEPAGVSEKDYCGSNALVGDGYCDDENNICSCDWDMGDCCGDQNHYGFCSTCACLDISYMGHDPTCNGNCGSGNYVGDGFCDDANNNCGCDWDNGDCCGSANSYAHCDDCFCIDPDSAWHINAKNQTGICTTPCANQAWYGDTFCDDLNNVCGCDWDGGDCCGGQNVYTYCDVCTCVDPLYSEWYGCPESQCEIPDHAGDQYCDDGNNNCGCDWDGGDCCGAEHFYTYCDDCLCLDPGYMGEVMCSGKCEQNAWQGDGYCDDGNNKCGCDWDFGDCCDHNSIYTECTDCLCLDPTWVASNCTIPCDKLSFQGDGYCDDGNNHCGCDWDNGDCCGTNGVPAQYAYCDDCRCQDPSSPDFTAVTDECAGTCYHTDWVQDTHCDDANNNCGCQWDGGDCCGPANNYNLCDACRCLDPTSKFVCTGSCKNSGWAGDGYCDDGNNNCACDWDNGDCCGDDNNYSTCNECECLDHPCRGGVCTTLPDDNGNRGSDSTPGDDDITNVTPGEPPKGSVPTNPMSTPGDAPCRYNCGTDAN